MAEDFLGGMQSASGWGDRNWRGDIEARSVVESAAYVLPLFSAAETDAAIAALPLPDLDEALRHKLVRVGGTAAVPFYAAVTTLAFSLAENHDKLVIARMAADDFRTSVFRYWGAMLQQHAAHALAREQPAVSARLRFSNGQIAVGCGMVFFGILAAATWGTGALLLAFNVLCSVVFAMVVALRVFCLLPNVEMKPHKTETLRDQDLPIYTVLVPLFRETAVLPQLVQALLALNYPIEKLDIKLILEQSDFTMHRAIAALHLPEHFDVVVVPTGTPQTKPRALNYGMQFARGSLVTIFDSEDIPDPQQLRVAASRFAVADTKLACLQAKLTFYNPDENWLTRQFTAEYATLFMMMLPQMAAHGLPLPLGGTSNHFRMSALLAVGGWDPYNVTEDADLGYRLARLGYHCGTLPSLTYEEANTELGNWMAQRRRWLKGFLHTWLVHMRQPWRLAKATGVDGFWVIQAMSIGVVLSALLHPFWIAHTAWFFLSDEAARQAAMPGHSIIIALNIAILALGYGAGLLLARAGLHRLGLFHWWLTLCTMPIYWMMMAPAAWLGLWDFIRRPHHWHKTRHGLSRLMQRPEL